MKNRSYWRRGAQGSALLKASYAACLAILASAEQAALAEKPRLYPPARSGMHVEVERGGGPLIIPVIVDFDDKRRGLREVPLRMVLDTGATRTAFDLRHRARLGQPIGATKTHTLAGEVAVEKFKPPRLRYGPITADPVDHVICCDLRAASAAFGETVDGLLGMDVLCLHATSIDFDAGTVEFYPAAGPEFGRAVSIEWHHDSAFRIPHVKADFGNGICESLLLDTGFVTTFAGTLNDEACDRLVNARVLTPLGPQAQAAIAASDEVVQLSLVRAGMFSIGPNSHRNLLFAKMRSSRLGLSYLSRYTVTFDFPNSVMYLKPGREFRRADAWEMCGLDVVRIGEGISVVGVADYSAAAAAGFHQGDLILAIDSTAVGKMSLSAFRRTVASAQRHVIRVRRAKTERDIQLDLGASSGANSNGDK